MEINAPLITTFFVGAVLLFWVVGAHNRLVGLRNAIAQAWGQIEEPLIRRHELLPEVVGALRDLVPAEQPALDAVIAASAQTAAAAASVRRKPTDAGAVASLALAEQVLAGATARLRGLLEHDRNLSDQAGMLEQLTELTVLDQRLSFRRQLFNQAVHHYNEAAAQFPTSLLTPLFRFELARSL